MMRTWQTRLVVDAAAEAALSAYAELYGRVERSLFVALQRGGVRLNDLKRDYLLRFGLTARQFNAIRIGLAGKIDSVKERRAGLLAEQKARIAKAEQVVKKLAARGAVHSLHQKKRRLVTLQQRHAAMAADAAAGRVRICFGSRRLFRAQFDLAGNGFASHADWQSAWRASRSGQFMVVGSKDETAGNQSCQLAPDGQQLTLRLPNAIGKRITLPVHLGYAEGSVLQALTLNRAISYRFVRDERGWRVFITTQLEAPEAISRGACGAIGVDINADHLAVTELDRHGNVIDYQRVPVLTYGKTQSQRQAAIGDAIKQVITRAVATKKPITLERLDFAQKKAALEAEKPRYARMLSALAYSQLVQTLTARAFDAGVEVKTVNPAFSSVIGRHTLRERYGISVHLAAAAVIGRRGLHLSERPRRHMAAQVAFALPVRDRSKHVWAFWRAVSRKEAAHAAQERLASRQSASPGQPRGARPICPLPAKSRHANRQQHCSAGVWPDVPF